MTARFVRLFVSSVRRCSSKAPKRSLQASAQRVVNELAEDKATWVHTPTTDSDVSMKSTMTSVADELSQRQSLDVCVLCYSNLGVRLQDKTFLYGPVALFPRVALSWRVLTPDDITEESVEFLTLLEPRLDLVLIGVGDKSNIDKVRSRLAPYFKKHNLPHEIHTTPNALYLFNYLNNEHRYVACLAYPPDEINRGTLGDRINLSQTLGLGMGAGPPLPYLKRIHEPNLPTVLDMLWGETDERGRMLWGEEKTQREEEIKRLEKEEKELEKREEEMKKLGDK